MEKLNTPVTPVSLGSDVDGVLGDTCRGASLGVSAADKARRTVFDCNSNASAASHEASVQNDVLGNVRHLCSAFLNFKHN